MNTASGRWPEIRALFDELADLTPDAQLERLTRLAPDPSLRAEVEALLRADRAAGDRFEHSATLPDDSDLAVPASSEAAGSLVGPYRITGEIGRGGMGAVYEAVRDDGGFSKRVALKTVPPGRDTEVILRRFRHERQILARLQHKNIAALLDGGVTGDGRPYFAMEHVEGERIDRYCDRLELDAAGRLQLMRQICAAVQYAHQHLVVHRDLKPGNVLVGPDGTVKLLDFGIAKLLDPTGDDEGLTDTGTLPMTTAYASPEQLRGEPINTATDIYSLGTMLYELLAGRAPFRFGDLPVLEIRRRMLEEVPVPPSRNALPGSALARLSHRNAGELDQIVMMAMRKEPERRYRSAEQLAEDLRRFLAGQPVAAQPDSVGYRARKFVRRNRAAVAALAVVFASVVTGLGFALWQARSVERERAKAEAVNTFLRNLLFTASPDTTVAGKAAPERTIKDVMDAASERLARGELNLHPDVRASLHEVVGRTYLARGDYTLAEQNLSAALAAQGGDAGRYRTDAAGTLLGLAQLALIRADYLAAAEFYERRLEILRREQRRGRITTDVLLAALSDFALIRRARGNSVEAEALLREALTLAPALPPDGRGSIGHLRAILALTILDQGRFDEAERSSRELVADLRQESGLDTPELASALTMLGSALMERGALEESGQHLREAERLYRRLYDSSHMSIADNLRLQAQVTLLADRVVEADSAIDRVLERYRARVSPQYVNFATALVIKGLAESRLGRTEAALATLREAVRLRTSQLPAGHFLTALAQGALGEALVRARRYPEAEPLLRQSHENLQRSQAAESRRITLARDRLRQLYTAWGRPGEGAAIPR